MRRGRWRLQRAAFDSDETGRARMNQLVPIGSLRLTHRRIKRGHRGPSRAKFPVFSLVKTLFAAALATSVGNEVLSEFSELGNSVCERRVQCRETRQRLEIDQLSCSAEWLARPVSPGDGTGRLPATMREILSKSLTLRGFINSEFAEQHYAEFLREVGAGIADGHIRYREDIVDGLDKAPEAFIGMLDGRSGSSEMARDRQE